MFTLRKENPFASPEPFHDEIRLHDDAERGFATSSTSQDVPSALGAGANAWGGSGADYSLSTALGLDSKAKGRSLMRVQ